jgi:hypothetical protein
MVALNVLLVPVAVREQDEAGLPVLVGYAPQDGAWLSRRVQSSPEQTAGELLESMGEPFARLAERLQATPRPVTFRDETARDRGVSLVYTLALPSALTEDGLLAAAAWRPLLRPRASALDAQHVGRDMLTDLEYCHDVVDYWRQQLEERNCALGFLPRYFTVRQLRDVYSAVWGYEQDPDGFSKWALGLRDDKQPLKRGALAGFIEELDLRPGDLDDDIARLMEEDSLGLVARQAAADAPDGAVLGKLLAKLGKPTTAVGVGAASTAVLSIGAVVAPPVALAAAIAAGSLVAFQASTRGPRRTWYRRNVDGNDLDQPLERLYQPRPAWLYAGSSRGS